MKKEFYNSKSLVYLWINDDESGCLTNLEFNFDPKFKVHFDVLTNEITVKDTDAVNIFNKDPVKNLTAIIGNNGVGKTSLFKRINSLPSYSVESIKNVNKIGYEKYEQHQKDIKYYIAVFLINDSITIINNYNKTIKYLEKEIGVGKSTLTSIKEVLRNYSRVYISFSNLNDYKQSSFVTEDNNEFYLTPSTLIQEGFHFFDYLTQVFRRNSFAEQIIPVFSREFYFENVLFAYSLVKEDFTKRLKTIKDEIEFSVINLFGNVVLKEYEKYREFKDYLVNNWKLSDRRITTENFSFILKVNLYTELFSLGYFIFRSNKMIISDEEAWNQACDHINNMEDNIQRAYFQKAIKEINLLEKLNFKLKTNLLPPTDLAYKISFVSSFKRLKTLFNLIFDKTAPSFLLKYMQFDFHYSDGEIVWIRLFSYLLYISKQELFTKNKNSYLKHNVMLLLDELDISLHPKLKVNFINDLLSFIDRRLKGKRVQVFLSSHSPVILSDIPLCNTIYLKRDDGKNTTIFNNGKETFGANISRLFADAFYFEDQLPIGSFSKKFINDLYVQFKENPLDEKIIKEINLIGDELIKNRFIKLNNGLKPQQLSDEIVSELKREIQAIESILSKVKNSHD